MAVPSGGPYPTIEHALEALAGSRIIVPKVTEELFGATGMVATAFSASQCLTDPHVESRMASPADAVDSLAKMVAVIVNKSLHR